MPWGAVAGAVVGSVANAALNGGGSQSQQSSQQQMPPWMQNQWQTVINMGNTAANRSASQAVAPLNANQNQAFANAQTMYGSGQQGMGMAGGMDTNVMQAGISPQSIQNYMNPYTSSVVNTTLGQMQQQENNQDAAINSQATAANAFGGNRAAVAQALNNQQWTNAMGQTAASLNNQGFMNAGQLAAQNAATQLQGANQLQNNILGSQQLLMGQNQNLLNAGNQQQQQSQNVANWPIQAAQIAGAALNPGVGGTVQSSGQYGNYMTGLQSGMMGANMGNNLMNYYNNAGLTDEQLQNAITGAGQYFGGQTGSSGNLLNTTGYQGDMWNTGAGYA